MIRRKGDANWTDILLRQTLGGAASILKKVIDDPIHNQKLAQILEQAAESSWWLSSLINDLVQFARDYRNRAAHGVSMDRAQLNGCRDLLIGQGCFGASPS
jgi:hypothetical protein